MDQSKVEHEFVFARRPVQWVIFIGISCVILGMTYSREVSVRSGVEDASRVESKPGFQESG